MKSLQGLIGGHLLPADDVPHAVAWFRPYLSDQARSLRLDSPVAAA